MSRRYQCDQGMLTIYFADQRLLTFRYLNQGPILHLVDFADVQGLGGGGSALEQPHVSYSLIPRLPLDIRCGAPLYNNLYKPLQRV